MGLATAQMRSIYLWLQRADLEYKIQLITEAKMNLGKTVSDLMNVGTDLLSDDPVVKKLEARKERLHMMEKQLDYQLAMYQSKLKMVDTELESSMKMVEKNIERSFKY